MSIESLRKAFLDEKRKDLLSLGSDTTPLLKTLGDPLYYISRFLIYYHISKQFLLYRPKTLLIDLYGASSIN